MKLVNLLLYGVSFLCFLLFLITGDSVLTAIGSVPFFVLLWTGIHELGHCAGCLLTGSTIREVRLPLFTVSGKKVRLNRRVSPVSCCSFLKNKHPWLVYLMGPVFSGLVFCLSFFVWHAFPSRTLLAAWILSLAVLMANVVPYRHNDMAMFLREILLRNENDS